MVEQKTYQINAVKTNSIRLVSLFDRSSRRLKFEPIVGPYD